MYKSISKQIKGCDDNELGIKRQSPLSINLSYDDEKPMKALFVFIAGTGDDNQDGYQEHLAEFVVREYGVAFLRVEYFCLNDRPQQGASYYMNDKDKEIFKQMCGRVGGIHLPQNLFDENDLPQNKTYGLFSWVDMTLGQLKDCNLLPAHFKLLLSLSIAPTKNEYLNFGIMQAQDIINAILYVRKMTGGGGIDDDFKGLCFEKEYKIIAFGSSHGGYLALKAAQIAPWLIDGVIENSCYVKIPWRLFGLGKWKDFISQSEYSVENVFKHIFCLVSTKTHFSLDENSKNYFCKDHENIRQIYEKDHIKTWAKFRKIPIISYHSVGDRLALSDDKVAFFEDLAKLGFENDFHLIKDQSEVDGKFIKTLEHGMGLSLKTLIIKELPKMLTLKTTKTRKKPRIVYEGEKFDYIFEEKDDEIVLELRANKRSGGK